MKTDMRTGPVICKHSTDVVDNAPKRPSSSVFEIGEICLNIADGYESLFIKNSDGEVIRMLLNGSAENADSRINKHIANESNPHGVTKQQIGLANIENHKDSDRSTSTAELNALSTKMNVSDIYASIEDDGSGRDFSKIPLSASAGPIIVDTISLINDNASGIESLDRRITNLENWE